MVMYILYCDEKDSRDEGYWRYRCGDKVIRCNNEIDTGWVKYFGNLDGDEYKKNILVLGHRKYKHNYDIERTVVDNIIEDENKMLSLLLGGEI